MRDCDWFSQESESGETFVFSHVTAALESVVDPNAAEEEDDDDDDDSYEDDEPVIPDRTDQHFIRGSSRETPFTTGLLKDDVDKKGNFDFEWAVKGSEE